MTRLRAFAAISAAAIFVGSAVADPPRASRSDVLNVYQTFQSSSATDEAEISQTEEGYVRFMLAPGDARFENDGTANKAFGDPAASASGFVSQHQRAFGMRSNRHSLAPTKLIPFDGSTVVKLKQEYDGIPVYGGQVNVQVDQNGDVISVLSDPMRDSGVFDQGFVSTTPSRTAQQAELNALQSVSNGQNFGDLVAYPAELTVYDPDVIGAPGEPRLAYRTRVQNASDLLTDREVLVDAHSGNILLSYSLICTAKNRYIYDLQFSPNWSRELPGTVARIEGGGLSTIDVVNKAYDYLGDTYDFYFNEHGRDGLDNAGSTLRASVRGPFQNAFFVARADLNGGPRTVRDLMLFGTGFVTDDITGHELTHGVTNYESNLIFAFESGAINESFSDIWGEFIDQTNGAGVDTAEVKWLMGEEGLGGAVRSMSDPPSVGSPRSPDRYSERLILPIFDDNGGVHFNSGIGNKLCFLLTDGTGGTRFNNQIVEPMGYERVADLFYLAQTAFLTQASDYFDLYFALVAASNQANWSFADKLNLKSAATAVEIVSFLNGKPLRHLRAQSVDTKGGQSVVLSWALPDYGNPQITLVRSTDGFPADLNSGLVIPLGPNATTYTDTNVTPGQQYFYGVFANFTGITAGPEVVYAQATVGEGIPNYLAESFPLQPDLSFSQIFYSPIGDPAPAFNSGLPESYVKFNDYSATFRPNVFQFPVARIDAVSLNELRDDETIVLGPDFFDRDFYFFGRLVDSLVVSSNGFITFTDFVTQHFFNIDASLHSPGLSSHWDVPRISFLFDDLVPAAGGDVWLRNMSDRLVITFDNVPEDEPFPPSTNSVQCELFYSGHIRMTYLQVQSSNVVVGLSDGRGIPPRPDTVNDEVPAPLSTNLSEVGSAQSLIIEPIPSAIVQEGDQISLLVRPLSSGGGTITLSASNQPSGSRFDIQPGPLGVFTWQTDSNDSGVYSPEFRATQGSTVAVQQTLIIVNDEARAPVASNLTIMPSAPEAGESISLTYTYESPESVSQGNSRIFWYRNGFFVSALFNSLIVPQSATTVGDSWTVAVVPVDQLGLAGQPVFLPDFTILPPVKADINEDGRMDAVDIQIVINGVLGKAEGAINPDATGDGKVDSVDVQSVINKVLGRR